MTGVGVTQRGGDGPPRLADALNHLFRTVPRSSGGALWTNHDAAAAMTEAGVPTSAAYLSQLRTGKRDNLSARHLSALARLFAVPMDYFFDPAVADKINTDLELLTAVRDAGVQAIALRARGLSPESLSGVVDLIEHIRRLEGRDAARPGPPDPTPTPPDPSPVPSDTASTSRDETPGSNPADGRYKQD